MGNEYADYSLVIKGTIRKALKGFVSARWSLKQGCPLRLELRADCIIYTSILFIFFLKIAT